MSVRSSDPFVIATILAEEYGEPTQIGETVDGRPLVALAGRSGLYGRDWLAVVVNRDGPTEASHEDVDGATFDETVEVPS